MHAGAVQCAPPSSFPQQELLLKAFATYKRCMLHQTQAEGGTRQSTTPFVVARRRTAEQNTRRARRDGGDGAVDHMPMMHNHSRIGLLVPCLVLRAGVTCPCGSKKHSAGSARSHSAHHRPSAVPAMRRCTATGIMPLMLPATSALCRPLQGTSELGHGGGGGHGERRRPHKRGACASGH